MSNEPEWISVEERLPPLGTEALLFGLVRGDYGYTEDEWRTVVGVCINQQAPAYSFVRGRYDGPIEVTHWLPIPEPPEVSNDE